MHAIGQNEVKRVGEFEHDFQSLQSHGSFGTADLIPQSGCPVALASYKSNAMHRH
jgi:hypothetical protein